jgi:hypothetical protein
MKASLTIVHAELRVNGEVVGRLDGFEYSGPIAALPAALQERARPIDLGERVRILAGPYAGRCGRIIRMIGGDTPRAFIQVELTRRETKPREDLRRIEHLERVVDQSAPALPAKRGASR